MSKKNEVAKAKTQELSAEMEVDFLADVGAGMEGADKDSFAIPFLTVLQALSPQVDESDAKYIEGARAGMLCDTVSGQLFDAKEGVLIVPCAFQRRYIHWGARGTDSSGFKGELQVSDVERMRSNGELLDVDGRLYFRDGDKVIDPNKADVASDTRNHFVLIYDPELGTATPALMSLAATQIKKSKQLMSVLNNVRVNTANGSVCPPTFASVIRVTSVPESNDKGRWYGLKFSREGFLTDKNVYTLAKEFYGQIMAGEVNVRYEEGGDASPSSTDDDGQF